MAKELLGTWKDLDHIFSELKNTGQIKQKYDELLAGGGKSIRLKIRLLDAAGQEVQFPVKLISDTEVF